MFHNIKNFVVAYNTFLRLQMEKKSEHMNIYHENVVFYYRNLIYSFTFRNWNLVAISCYQTLIFLIYFM